MNALLTDLCSSAAAQRLGWALLHFLWQGAAVAMLLAVVLQLTNRRSARVRYAAACCALAALALLPAVTAVLIAPAGPAATVAATIAPAAPEVVPPRAPAAAEPPAWRPAPAGALPAVDQAPAQGPLAAAGPMAPEAKPAQPAKATWLQRAEGAVRPCLPWGVLAWIVGVICLSIWHLSGWLLLQRIRRMGTLPAGSDLIDTLGNLRRRLAMTRPVRLLESAMVKAPTVIGWLRPVVLIPIGIFCGLSPSQVEAILAHELAHIWRYDCLVRMIQAAVETLLFYHPAVWWVSGRIRQESEHCCDELAVGVCGDRTGYAQALAAVAGAGSVQTRSPSRLAPAAGGGKLLPRIRRILGLAERPGGNRARSFAGVVMSLLVLAAILGVAIGRQARPSESPATQPATRPTDSGALEDLARRFLAALRDGDLETMKALSVGSVEGWLGDKVMPPDYRGEFPVGWSAEWLRKASAEIRQEVFSKNPDSAKTIVETVIEGEFAATRSPGVKGKDDPQYFVLVFVRTSQGWRFATLDEGKGALKGQLAEHAERLAKLNRPAATQPATRPGGEAYSWPPKAQAEWVTGLWMMRRTDKPGPSEPGTYMLLLNPDKSWACISVWGEPSKPSKTEVTQRGPEWELKADGTGKPLIVRWADATHSSYFGDQPLTHITGSTLTLHGWNLNLFVTYEYERCDQALRDAIQKAIAGSGVTAGKMPAAPSVDWPGKPDTKLMTGTWIFDQSSPDKEHVFLTIRPDGTWALGHFYGGPANPARIGIVQQGPDWRLTEGMGKTVQAYFHQPPLPTGGDPSWSGEIQRLTSDELALPNRAYHRASPELAALLAAATQPATRPVTGPATMAVTGPALWPLEGEGGKCGYVDRSWTFVIPPRFERAKAFSEGVAAVAVGQGWGYIDANGSYLWRPQFEEAYSFSDSLARVCVGTKDGPKYGFINKTRFVAEAKYDEAGDFHEGRARVNLGASRELMVNIPIPRFEGGKWGFLDANGGPVVPARFDSAYDFSEGLALVSLDGNWGYIDLSGKVAIRLPHDWKGSIAPESFSDGLAAIRVDDRTRFIDRTGRIVLEANGWAESFHEGLAAICVGKKWGFIDKSGKVVIEPNHAEAGPFCEGLTRVRMEKTPPWPYGMGDRWGFIDRTGKMVIEPRFNQALHFADGMAWVHLGGNLNERIPRGLPTWEGGEWLVIDRTGNTVYPKTQPATRPAPAATSAPVAASAGKAQPGPAAHGLEVSIRVDAEVFEAERPIPVHWSIRNVGDSDRAILWHDLHYSPVLFDITTPDGKTWPDREDFHRSFSGAKPAPPKRLVLRPGETKEGDFDLARFIGTLRGELTVAGVYNPRASKTTPKEYLDKPEWKDAVMQRIASGPVKITVHSPQASGRLELDKDLPAPVELWREPMPPVQPKLFRVAAAETIRFEDRQGQLVARLKLGWSTWPKDAYRATLELRGRDGNVLASATAPFEADGTIIGYPGWLLDKALQFDLGKQADLAKAEYFHLTLTRASEDSTASLPPADANAAVPRPAVRRTDLITATLSAPDRLTISADGNQLLMSVDSNAQERSSLRVLPDRVFMETKSGERTEANAAALVSKDFDLLARAGVAVDRFKDANRPGKWLMYARGGEVFWEVRADDGKRSVLRASEFAIYAGDGNLRAEAPAAFFQAAGSRPRHFVLLVVGKDQMTLQGEPVTRDGLSAALGKVPGRARTVLEIAAAADATVGQYEEMKSVCSVLALQLGYEYLSVTGIKALGAKGEATQWIPIASASQPATSPSASRPAGPSIPAGAAAEPVPNAVPPAPADLVAEEPKEYLIGPTDIVDISIMDIFTVGVETVFRREVSESGLIELPLLKERTIAQGLTKERLKAEIAKAYNGAGVFKNATVGVTIVRKRTAVFSILGAVSRTGVYALPGKGLRLLEALALAGDINQGSDISWIYVIRADPAGGQGPASAPAALAAATGPAPAAPRVIAIDLGKLSAGDARMNVVIRDGDVIFVQRGNVGEFYVMGDVERPGVYSLTGRRITVKMALAAAGKPAKGEWSQKSALIRRVGAYEEQVIPLNVKAILGGKEGDLFLQCDDVLIVGSDTQGPSLNPIRTQVEKLKDGARTRPAVRGASSQATQPAGKASDAGLGRD